MCGERTVVRRPAVKMAAAMMPAPEMVAVTTTTMAAAMTAAAATAMTTFGDRKVCYRQRRCEDNGGNSQRDF
jgi:hypothetical protein